MFSKYHNQNTALDPSCTSGPEQSSTFNLFRSGNIQSTTYTKPSQSYRGGGKPNEFSYEQLKPYMLIAF